MNRSVRFAKLMLCLATLVRLSADASVCAAADGIDADAAVQSGREALSDSGSYPWYDSDADDVRRIKVKPPAQQTNTSFSLFSGGDWFTPFAWVGTSLLLALIIFVLVRTYLARERGAASQGSLEEDDGVGDHIDRVEDLPIKIRRPVSDLLSEARRQYELGNYTEAVIYYYSHQLVQLDRRQLIRLTKGKTNRQYLREIASRRGLFQSLGETMVVFEEVFFGKHPLDRDRFDVIWNRRDEFENLLEQAAV